VSGGADVDSLLALLGASGLDEASYRNEVPARIGLTIPAARPGRNACNVACPILFCIADRDDLAPAAATVRHASRAPRGEIRHYDTGHFDIYLGHDFDAAITGQLAFLTRHLEPVEWSHLAEPLCQGERMSAAIGAGNVVGHESHERRRRRPGSRRSERCGRRDPGPCSAGADCYAASSISLPSDVPIALSFCWITSADSSRGVMLRCPHSAAAKPAA
jgi:hypothetical protein